MNLNSDKHEIWIFVKVFDNKKKNPRDPFGTPCIREYRAYVCCAHSCNCIALLVRVRVIGSAQADLLAPINGKRVN